MVTVRHKVVNSYRLRRFFASLRMTKVHRKTRALRITKVHRKTRAYRMARAHRMAREHRITNYFAQYRGVLFHK